MLSYRGRFAPSPTGDLHLGGACTALCAWLAARAGGGRFVMRIEDLDTPRVLPGSESRILEDLQWLGIDWDEGPEVGGNFGPYRQSERTQLYERAIEQLDAAGLVFPCDCSRTEILRASSAPHPGEEGPIYPGTCRASPAGRSYRRPPALRLRVPDVELRVDDAVQGARASRVASDCGDFVLRRGDGLFAYQLAVVVDDLAMGITEVVRGADLLSSTPRQVLLATMLGGALPRYAHAPLVVSEDGSKLAKRARGVAVRHHREAGEDPRHLVASIARAIGLARDDELALSPSELVDRFDWGKVRKGPVPIPSGTRTDQK